MDTKKIAATFAILMIALGVAGCAYAHWEKIVYVEGTVTTGTLHVTPSFHVDYTEAENKMVADIGAEVDPEDNSIYIWFDNVYPCLEVDGYIDFENDGTIPVHLVDMYCEGNETVWLEEVETGHYKVYDGNYLIANLYVEYCFPDGTETDPFQIDPESTAYIYFTIHFKEDLPQGVYYWFYLEFTFWNWNESP